MCFSTEFLKSGANKRRKGWTEIDSKDRRGPDWPPGVTISPGVPDQSRPTFLSPLSSWHYLAVRKPTCCGRWDLISRRSASESESYPLVFTTHLHSASFQRQEERGGAAAARGKGGRTELKLWHMSNEGPIGINEEGEWKRGGGVPPVHTRGNETATRSLTKLMIINQNQPSKKNPPPRFALSLAAVPFLLFDFTSFVLSEIKTAGEAGWGH